MFRANFFSDFYLRFFLLFFIFALFLIVFFRMQFFFNLLATLQMMTTAHRAVNSKDIETVMCVIFVFIAMFS